MRNPSAAVDGFRKSSTHPTVYSRASLPHPPEIPQIRRRLVLAGGHEVAVAAAVIGLRADLDQLLVARAVILLPHRIGRRLSTVALEHRPRPREGVIDQG